MIHLSDEDLEVYATHRDIMESCDAAELHLADCVLCRAQLASHRQFEESLRDIETWRAADPGADSDRESLNAMAIQMQREDEEAERLLLPFLAAPDSVFDSELASDRKYQTGGVARRLCEAAHHVCAQSPLQALSFSEAAIAISEALPDRLYPAGAVHAVRGLSWKERANALRFLDRFREALNALDRAEHFYAQLTSPELDIAIVASIRAFVLLAIDDLNGAEAMVEKGYAVFRHLGQDARLMSVLFVKGAVLRRRGDAAGAIEAFQRALAIAEMTQDTLWSACAKADAGWCHVDVGDPAKAGELFRASRETLAEMGYVSDVTRCDWGIAIVSRDLGEHREALAQLLAVSAAFAEQKVVVDSAMAMVEAFEIMLAIGEADGIEQLATGLVATLTEAGQMDSALTAVAYVKEAAARKSVTPEILRAARTFLRRVDRHRDLIFAPPPFF